MEKVKNVEKSMFEQFKEKFKDFKEDSKEFKNGLFPNTNRQMDDIKLKIQTLQTYLNSLDIIIINKDVIHYQNILIDELKKNIPDTTDLDNRFNNLNDYLNERNTIINNLTDKLGNLTEQYEMFNKDKIKQNVQSSIEILEELISALEKNIDNRFNLYKNLLIAVIAVIVPIAIPIVVALIPVIIPTLMYMLIDVGFEAKFLPLIWEYLPETYLKLKKRFKENTLSFLKNRANDIRNYLEKRKKAQADKLEAKKKLAQENIKINIQLETNLTTLTELNKPEFKMEYLFNNTNNFKVIGVTDANRPINYGRDNILDKLIQEKRDNALGNTFDRLRLNTNLTRRTIKGGNLKTPRLKRKSRKFRNI